MDHEITHHQQAGLQDYSAYSSTGMGMQSFEPSSEIYGGLHGGLEMLGMTTMPPPFQRVADALTESLMVAPEALTVRPWQATNRLPLADVDSASRIIDAGHQQPAASRQLSLTLFHPHPSNSIFQQQAYAQHALSSARGDQVAAQKAMDVLQGGRLLQPSISPAATGTSTLYPEQFPLKNSKYMVPAQQLLNESFNLEATKCAAKHSSSKSKQGEPSSSKLQQLHAMDISELQKRKAKLLSLVEEVDRRYKRYCEQTRSVVCSFEAVAGEGAGEAYMALASAVMSRHFRTLRDCIVEQIRAVKKVIEEVDPAADRSTRAETPRLKMIDQYAQQQKAFHQVGMMESHPWRPQRGLPQRAVSILRAWLFEHFLHPYPSDVDKQILSRQTGLSRSQVSNWFINARVRLWKPMVEEMYLEEVKEKDKEASHHGENNSSDMKPNQNPSNLCSSSELETDEDEKPATAQLLVDSDSLSSVVNNTHSRRRRGAREHEIFWEGAAHGHGADQLQASSSDQGNFGVMDLDFGSYNQCNNEGNYGKGVLLTLGLQQQQQQRQQQDGNGVCLSFSPASRHSQFFAGEQMEECHGGGFSILDGTQSIPYRNLAEAQLLNHFG